MAAKPAKGKKRIVLLLAAIASLAVFAAACGDGDSNEANPLVEPAETVPTPSPETPAPSDRGSGSSSSGSDEGSSNEGTSSSESSPDPVPDPTAEATQPAPTPASTAPTTPPPVPLDSDLPDVTILRVSTGEELNLSSLAPASRPLLLWFWAPH